VPATVGLPWPEPSGVTTRAAADKAATSSATPVVTAEDKASLPTDCVRGLTAATRSRHVPEVAPYLQQRPQPERAVSYGLFSVAQAREAGFLAR